MRLDLEPATLGSKIALVWGAAGLFLFLLMGALSWGGLDLQVRHLSQERANAVFNAVEVSANINGAGDNFERAVSALAAARDTRSIVVLVPQDNAFRVVTCAGQCSENGSYWASLDQGLRSHIIRATQERAPSIETYSYRERTDVYPINLRSEDRTRYETGIVVITLDTSSLVDRVRGPLVFAGLAIFFALLLSAAAIYEAISRLVVRPLRQVHMAMIEGDGALISDHKILARNNEIGELARGFNRMIKARDAALATLQAYQFGVDQFAIVAITDRSGAITYANDMFSQVSGYEESEFLGKNHRFLNSGTHPRSFFVNLWRTIGKGSTWRGEICNRAKDGRHYWMDTTIVPIMDGQGKPESYIAVRIDRTEQRLAKEKLECTLLELEEQRALLEQRVKERTIEIEYALHRANEASKAKSTFLATMSHELRTPLHTIISYTELVREDLAAGGGADAGVDLEQIIIASKHLLELINSVLDLSKIESGKMTAHADQFDVVALLREIAAGARPMIERNGNVFDADLAGSSCTVLTDRTKLKQCVINLLSNAGKFTRDGRVSLAVSQRDIGCASWLQIEVADTGIGMSKEQAAELFQPFYQIEVSQANRAEGTGLGLSLSKKFAQLLGGDITVETELGRGSRFTLAIPCALPEASLRGVREEAA